MADNNSSSAVSIVGILAIVILVGLAIYFVFYVGGDDDDLEVDVGGLERDVPVQTIQRTATTPPPPVQLRV